MTTTISADEIADHLRPGMTVYVGGASGESPLIRDALSRRPDCAAGVDFIGAQLPGINVFDYAGLHPQATSQGIFVTPAQRTSFATGRHRLLRMGYHGFASYLRDRPVDLALLLLSESDADGSYGFGANADLAGIAAAGARVVIAEVNATLPRNSGERLPANQVQFAVRSNLPIAHPIDAAPDPVQERIAHNVAGLISDGDILQIGIGKLPSAVLGRLTSHRRLGLHSGLISDGCLDLIEAGVLTGETNPIDPRLAVAAGAIGSARLYAALNSPLIDLRSALRTHDADLIRQLPNFVSINSAIEVDLFGQFNADTVGGRFVAGVGGFNDFVRAARQSRGGRSIVALPSRSKSASRIAASLPFAPITALSGDIDFLVTENGTADLRHKSIDQTAAAIIAIAAPEDRPELTAAWQSIRSRL
ncbi:acetyl-CoA hydrolase/transferase C-terminal domain-containing protein [Bradyrhizobium sp. 14AA]